MEPARYWDFNARVYFLVPAGENKMVSLKTWLTVNITAKDFDTACDDFKGKMDSIEGVDRWDVYLVTETDAPDKELQDEPGSFTEDE